MKSIVYLLIGLAMVTSAFAGPPKNATKHMMPFPVICTPTMTEMMEALTKDYAVHISMTFEETPENGVVIVQNPNTTAAAVLHLTSERVCLIFSGMHMQEFVRPEGMAPPEVAISQDFEES